MHANYLTVVKNNITYISVKRPLVQSQAGWKINDNGTFSGNDSNRRDRNCASLVVEVSIGEICNLYWVRGFQFQGF